MDPLETRASDPEQADQRVTLHDISWDLFEGLMSARGDDAGVRIAYCDGVHTLAPSGYRLHKQSRLLPTLDLELLSRFLLRDDPLEVAREYRRALRARRSVS